jgi:transcriptional regulator with XRE-family HTH domain
VADPQTTDQASDDVGLKAAVGRRLAEAREALGFTMTAFARLHGVDKTKLNHWEKGRHYPDPLFIVRLHTSHGITADWIYLGLRRSLPHDLWERMVK